MIPEGLTTEVHIEAGAKEATGSTRMTTMGDAATTVTVKVGLQVTTLVTVAVVTKPGTSMIKHGDVMAEGATHGIETIDQVTSGSAEKLA